MILTAENYFSTQANLEYMSNSQFKDFEECEFMAVEKIYGRYSETMTDAFLLGQYIDAHFECRLDIFKGQHPEYKRIQKKADKIIQKVESDRFFMGFMAGQKQVVMTGEIAGVPVKIKMDVYHPDKMIVDFKAVKDFRPMYKPAEGRLNFIEYWGYDMQGAIYREIVYQNAGKRLPFIITAATKEETPDMGIFEIPQEVMDSKLKIFEAKAPGYQALKLPGACFFASTRCERCPACRQSKVLGAVTTWEELNNFYD